MPLLEISQLKKSFTGPDGEKQSIIDVRYFTLAAKAQVAIQGESGSGKTTFLHLIAGILKPDSGSVLLALKGACPPTLAKDLSPRLLGILQTRTGPPPGATLQHRTRPFRNLAQNLAKLLAGWR